MPVTPLTTFGSAATEAASGLPKSHWMFVAAAPEIEALKPTGSP